MLCLENLPQHLKKLGEGKTKGEMGRKKGRWKDVQRREKNNYVLKTFPAVEKGKGKKKGERGRKKCTWKGIEYFQCYVLKTFPSTLKNEGNG